MGIFPIIGIFPKKEEIAKYSFRCKGEIDLIYGKSSQKGNSI
jgi:hypothetical protein